MPSSLTALPNCVFLFSCRTACKGVENSGIFKSKDCVRTLWLGLSGDVSLLGALRSNVEKALIPLGYIPENRKFIPHV